LLIESGNTLPQKQRMPQIIEQNSASAIVLKINRRKLLDYVDNWNRFVAIPDPELLSIAEAVLSGRLEFLTGSIEIPLIELNKIISSIGIDAHQFHDNFSVVRTTTPYPIVYSGEES